MTLDEFLLARISEREKAARSCRDWPECDPSYGCEAHAILEDVLADCQSKRLIVENERAARKAMGSAPLEVHLRSQDGPASAYWRGQDYVLRLMAAVDAAHPDYDERWRP